MLRLVLPKGSLEQATFELFAAADLAVSRASDVAYRATIDDPRVVDGLSPFYVWTPDYAEKRLGLSERSMYRYLQIYDWVRECHKQWLEPGNKERNLRNTTTIDKPATCDNTVANGSTSHRNPLCPKRCITPGRPSQKTGPDLHKQCAWPDSNRRHPL